MLDDEETGLLERLLRRTSGRAMSLESGKDEGMYSPVDEERGREAVSSEGHYDSRWRNQSSSRASSEVNLGGRVHSRHKRSPSYSAIDDSGEEGEGMDRDFYESGEGRRRARRGLAALLDAFKGGEEGDAGGGSSESTPLLDLSRPTSKYRVSAQEWNGNLGWAPSLPAGDVLKYFPAVDEQNSVASGWVWWRRYLTLRWRVPCDHSWPKRLAEREKSSALL